MFTQYYTFLVSFFSNHIFLLLFFLTLDFKYKIYQIQDNILRTVFQSKTETMYDINNFHKTKS